MVSFLTEYILKGYSIVSLIRGLTHLDTEYDPPSWDKVCGPLAYVVLASSETTAQQQYTALRKLVVRNLYLSRGVVLGVKVC